jgi:hypothetical protein
MNDEVEAHWVRIRNREERPDITCEGPYERDCAFCKMSDAACVGCPIRERTGLTGCVGTPFAVAYGAWRDWRYSGTEYDRKAWRKAADKMIAFIRSLREKP